MVKVIRQKGFITDAHGRFSRNDHADCTNVHTHTCFLGATPFRNPKGTSIGSAVFAGLDIVTDRPTDRPRYFVSKNRLHRRIRSIAMWLNHTLAR